MEENSFFPKRSGKTASQIIAEAKASIGKRNALKK